MPLSCSVPFCRSVHRKIGIIQRSFFSFPKEPDRAETWRRLIPKKDFSIKKWSKICDLHFKDSFILRNYEHLIGGEVVTIPRSVPILTADAVPTIFPNLPTRRSCRFQESGPAIFRKKKEARNERAKHGKRLAKRKEPEVLIMIESPNVQMDFEEEQSPAFETSQTLGEDNTLKQEVVAKIKQELEEEDDDLETTGFDESGEIILGGPCSPGHT